MNLLSKDIIDLSPFAAEGTPISASEVQSYILFLYIVYISYIWLKCRFVFMD